MRMGVLSVFVAWEALGFVVFWSLVMVLGCE